MTPVEAEIRQRIAVEGPVSVARMMALANAHYYATRDPFGSSGDFVTSPEISQIFGELLGLWAAAQWTMMGRPDPVLLVELGPGRGTLMADALRAARIAPGFEAALRVHLVETSAVLRAAQKRTLESARPPIGWHDRIEDVPAGPAIFLANEFFDALPIRQFVRTETGWHERLVGLGEDDRLAFGMAPFPEPDALVPPAFAAAPVASLAETSPDGLKVIAGIAERLRTQNGAALFVDYGHARSGPGDTLQAVRAHRFADVLTDLGDADLTAHVDFAALAAEAERAGAAAHGPVTQRDFLLMLGMNERAAILKRQASAEQAATLDSGVARLLDPGPTGMGALFKVLALTKPGLPAPPGLATIPA